MLYFQNINLNKHLMLLQMSKLTQKQILQALLEGKKIFDKDWEFTKYIHLVGDNIVDNNNKVWNIESISNDSELYIETVSFFEALEAMKEGKMARPINSNYEVYFNGNNDLTTRKHGNFCIKKFHFDIQWQILEGDSE